MSSTVLAEGKSKALTYILRCEGQASYSTFVP